MSKGDQLTGEKTQFAKLFEKDGVQVLVKIDADSLGLPAVDFFSTPKGFGVCRTGVSFADTSEGWEKAQRFFDSITEEKAFEYAQHIFEFSTFE